MLSTEENCECEESDTTFEFKEELEKHMDFSAGASGHDLEYWNMRKRDINKIFCKNLVIFYLSATKLSLAKKRHIS